jgi:hypothetical protein
MSRRKRIQGRSGGWRQTACCRLGLQARRNSFSGLVELNRCVWGGRSESGVRQRFNKRCLAQSDSRRTRSPNRQQALWRWMAKGQGEEVGGRRHHACLTFHALPDMCEESSTWTRRAILRTRHCEGLPRGNPCLWCLLCDLRTESQRWTSRDDTLPIR